MDLATGTPMADPPQKSTTIKTLLRQMSESKSILERNGSDGHADIICQNAIQEAAQILDPDDSHLLDARELHAQILASIHRDDPREAIEKFRQILQWRIRLDGPNHTKTGSTRLRLARTMWTVDNYDVEVLSEISSFIRRHQIHLETDQDFKMVTGVGTYLLNQQRHEEAEQIFRAVLNQGKEVSLHNSLQTLEARRKLAVTLRLHAQSLEAQEGDVLPETIKEKILEACSHAAKNVRFLKNDERRNAQDYQKNWELLQKCENDLATIQSRHESQQDITYRTIPFSNPGLVISGNGAPTTSGRIPQSVSGGTPMETTISCPPTYVPLQTGTSLLTQQTGLLKLDAVIPRTKSASAIVHDKGHNSLNRLDEDYVPNAEFMYTGSQFHGSEARHLDTIDREEQRSRMGIKEQGTTTSQYLSPAKRSNDGPPSISTEDSGLKMPETARAAANSGVPPGIPPSIPAEMFVTTTLSPHSKKSLPSRKRSSDASAASESHALREFRDRTVKGITEFFSTSKRDSQMEGQMRLSQSSPPQPPRVSTEQSDVVQTSLGKLSDSRASTIVTLTPTLGANGVASTKPVKWVLDLKESGISLSDLSSDKTTARAADNWLGRLDSTHKLLANTPKRRGETNVRICIIDTGFDGLHPLLFAKPFGRGWGRRIKGCISFNEEQQKVVEEGWLEWSKSVHAKGEVLEVTGYSDEDGHGTHCAGLILEMAPQAEIFIAKVGSGRDRDPNPDLIAQAIDHASDPLGWNVDIISMSFGFEPNIASIEDAINRHSQRVVMFAAAANDGANSDVIAFPARLDNVICIKAGNGDGALSDFSQKNRRDAGDNFFTLGEEAVSLWPSQRLPNGVQLIQKRASGTSVATPIAAAIAALVLEFTRQIEGKTGPQLLQQCAKDIAQSPRDRIKKIFRGLSETNENSNGRYVVPWIFLGKGRSHAARKIHESLSLPELFSRNSDLGKRPL